MQKTTEIELIVLFLNLINEAIAIKFCTFLEHFSGFGHSPG